MAILSIPSTWSGYANVLSICLIKVMDSAYQIAEGAGEIAAQVEDMKTIDLSPNEKGVFVMAAHKLVYDAADNAPILWYIRGRLLKPR
jgi:hypothetical protein